MNIVFNPKEEMAWIISERPLLSVKGSNYRNLGEGAQADPMIKVYIPLIWTTPVPY